MTFLHFQEEKIDHETPALLLVFFMLNIFIALFITTGSHETSIYLLLIDAIKKQTHI